MVSLGSLRFRWVFLDIRGSDQIYQWASDEVHWIASGKSCLSWIEERVREGLEVGRGEKREENSFPQLLFFSETIFCFWNKLHKYVIYGRYCSCHATVRARQKEIYSLLWHWPAEGRKASPAWPCVSLQPIELTPGSWSNFYCHEGVVDSHLRVFIRLEYNIAWSIYWMYMGLYSHLVSSHNYYSHYPVISWSGSQRTWSDLARTHTHTDENTFLSVWLFLSHLSAVNGYIISSERVPWSPV